MKLRQLSAKNLGQLALRPYCPRCSWIKLNCKLPYQIFPGIFSSIDSYTKKVVHGHFNKHGQMPSWLSDIGDITGYIDPPHYSKFQIPIEEYGILLTGAPDLILKFSDGTICIADYKTSRFSKAQEGLMPQYKVQLNGYAKIAEYIGLGKVSKLVLIYTDPRTSDSDAQSADTVMSDGFNMSFHVKLLEIPYDTSKYLTPALESAQELLKLKSPPTGRSQCKECETLVNFVGIFG